MIRRSVSSAVLSAMILSACTGAKDSAAVHLAKARDLLVHHDDVGALAAIQTAIKVDPRSRDAHLMLGEALARSGDVGGSYGEYLRADMLDPSDHRARFKAIDILIEAQELDAALGRINATLGDDPGSVDALALRALVESRLGKVVKARTDASKVLATAPGNPVANAAMAELALRDKNSAAALASIDRGLATVPSNVTLLRLQSAAFLAAKAPDKAVAVNQKLVALNPTSPDFRSTLAETQMAAGSFEAGLKTVTDGVAAAPGSREMRLGLVGYLMRHGTPEALDAALRTAIAAAPDTSIFDLVLAGQAAQRGDGPGAVKIIQAAIDRLFDGAARTEARLGLARLMAQRGDSAEEIAILDTVLKAAPENDDALLLRGDLALRRGDPAGAVTDLLAVAARRPSDPVPYDLLANAYLRLGRFEDALDAEKRITDLNPTDLPAALRLVELAMSLDRPKDARAVLDAFVERNPGSLDGRAAAIRLATVTKDWAAAQAGLDALRRLPDSERASLELEAQRDETRGAAADAAALYKRLVGLQGLDHPDAGTLQAFARTSLAAGQGPAAVGFIAASWPPTGPVHAAGVDLALAALHQGLGEAAPAAAATEAAIRQAPTDPEPYLFKASLLFGARQPDAALAALDAGLAAGVPPAQLLFAKAVLQDRQGQPDAAMASYRQILAVQPDALLAANNLTSLLADRRPLDRAALETARDTLRSLASTANPSVLDTMAWADYRLGRFDRARDLLDRAHAGTSDRPELRFHYGAVLIAMGKKEAGRTLIQAALKEEFPGKPEAESLMTQ